MKHILSLALLFIVSSGTFAQLKTPKDSPKSKLEQKVGLSTITVDYSRPGVKDRKVFGELVAYDQVWRTGANSSTIVEFSQEVIIHSDTVPAGKYALFTIPGEKEWTVIFSHQLDLWGAFGYKQEEDELRFQVEPIELERKVETFTIDFSHLHPNGAHMNLSWENTLVQFPLKAVSTELVEKQIKKLLMDGPSTGTYYGAARHYLENGKDLNQALEWINVAIEKYPQGYWMIYRKALIEQGLGKIEDAIATAEHCRKLAVEDPDGDYGYTKLCNELLLELKKK